jgi:hypothetical protein
VQDKSVKLHDFVGYLPHSTPAPSGHPLPGRGYKKGANDNLKLLDKLEFKERAIFFKVAK